MVTKKHAQMFKREASAGYAEQRSRKPASAGDGVAAPAHAVPVPISLKGGVARYLAYIHSALLQADCLTLHCSIV